jgi:TfoX/Sxy family transcriptional regulator of competence genes
MQWKKSPPELIAVFDSVVPGAPAVRRSMFGYPAAFVNGNMFMGLHQSNMVLRFGEGARQEFLAISGARIFEPMAGRPMREYVVVPPSLLTDPEKLQPWVKQALDYGTSLKPKQRSGKKAPARTAARKVQTKKKK